MRCTVENTCNKQIFRFYKYHFSLPAATAATLKLFVEQLSPPADAGERSAVLKKFMVVQIPRGSLNEPQEN